MLYASLQNDFGLKPLQYLCKAGIHNPSTVVILRATDSLAEVKIPFAEGEYIFSSLLYPATTQQLSALITRTNKGISAFDIDTSHADR